MAWGMISCHGAEDLIWINKNKEKCNTENYTAMLDDNQILDKIKASGKTKMFMQDKAPCHKSKVTMEYIKNQNVTVFDWPPNSPDMNPIENIWGVIKDELFKVKDQLKTK